MSGEEQALVFHCQGEPLVGVLHPGAEQADFGVLVIVGGPQYRVGSHRQFVVMARALSSAGVPVMRFDCRGMGDAGGERASFEALDADIDAAIGMLRRRRPGIRRIVLLGLCDGACAAVISGHRRDDVAGMILINPWVRDDADEAGRPLHRYYLARLRQGRLWRSLVARRFRLLQSLGGLFRALANARRQRRNRVADGEPREPAFIDKMRAGLGDFIGPVLVLISGADLTGREFLDLCRSNPDWRAAAGSARLRTHVVPDADHTMSSRLHLDEATRECVRWLQEEVAAAPGPA